MANEVDEMEKFLKLEIADSTVTSSGDGKVENGTAKVPDKEEEPEQTENVVSNGEQEIVNEVSKEVEDAQES